MLWTFPSGGRNRREVGPDRRLMSRRDAIRSRPECSVRSFGRFDSGPLRRRALRRAPQRRPRRPPLPTLGRRRLLVAALEEGETGAGVLHHGVARRDRVESLSRLGLTGKVVNPLLTPPLE